MITAPSWQRSVSILAAASTQLQHAATIGTIKLLQKCASIGSLRRGLWADFGSRIAISGNNVRKDCPCVTCRFLMVP